MVHCPECWTKNEEDAKYCVKCGKALEGSRGTRAFDSLDEWGEEIGRRAERWGEQFEKRMEKECFGLPHGGAIAGLIFGMIIILVGLSWAMGFEWVLLWPIMIIIFGTLIIAGAVYGLSRR